MADPAPGPREHLRHRLTQTLAGDHPGGRLYGAIVTAAVLVAVGGHDNSVGDVVAVWAVVLGTYWLTHIYVDTLQREFHGDQRNLVRRGLSSAGSESAVLEGGVPAIVVFLAASLLGGDDVAAEEIAIWFTVALLALVGYLGARHTGRTRGAAYVEALGASMLGLVMVAAKTLLH